MYACAKGKTDMATNTSNVVGIHIIATGANLYDTAHFNADLPTLWA
jgi:hypothetical protein